eukprot:TRINITY_DN8881_c1_g4_i1.p1 TRINITY_DN8881_c1_g4~~TRINITY_DN8881_c1_g4_i1.p1  ORF type:complete len:389 (-),score=76.83 TRINITY_DN8881_c1_g4_i1:52-1218(-)
MASTSSNVQTRFEKVCQSLPKAGSRFQLVCHFLEQESQNEVELKLAHDLEELQSLESALEFASRALADMKSEGFTKVQLEELLREEDQKLEAKLEEAKAELAFWSVAEARRLQKELELHREAVQWRTEDERWWMKMVLEREDQEISRKQREQREEVKTGKDEVSQKQSEQQEQHEEKMKETRRIEDEMKNLKRRFILCSPALTRTSKSGRIRINRNGRLDTNCTSPHLDETSDVNADNLSTKARKGSPPRRKQKAATSQSRSTKYPSKSPSRSAWLPNRLTMEFPIARSPAAGRLLLASVPDKQLRVSASQMGLSQVGDKVRLVEALLVKVHEEHELRRQPKELKTACAPQSACGKEVAKALGTSPKNRCKSSMHKSLDLFRRIKLAA